MSWLTKLDEVGKKWDQHLRPSSSKIAFGNILLLSIDPLEPRLLSNLLSTNNTLPSTPQSIFQLLQKVFPFFFTLLVRKPINHKPKPLNLLIHQLPNPRLHFSLQRIL